MKKTFLILTIFLLSLSLVTTASATIFSEKTFAQNKKPTVLFEQVEITDKEVLFERAKNNLTDREVPFSFKGSSVTPMEAEENDNIEAHVDSYSTTQLLRTVELGNDVVVNKYVTDSFQTLSLRDKFDYTWDPDTYGCRAYSRIYWNEIMDDGQKYYSLYSVQGGWDNIDSQYTLSNRSVTLGQSGWGLGGYVGLLQEETLPVYANSYSRSADSSWIPVFSGYQNNVGAFSEVTITRFGTSWDFISNPNYLNQ